MAIGHIFLSPGTISTAHDPGYTKIGRPSKLDDLVISGRFRGLEHTVLAPDKI